MPISIYMYNVGLIESLESLSYQELFQPKWVSKAADYHVTVSEHGCFLFTRSHAICVINFSITTVAITLKLLGSYYTCVYSGNHMNALTFNRGVLMRTQGSYWP